MDEFFKDEHIRAGYESFRLVNRIVIINGTVSVYHYIPLSELLQFGWTREKAKAYYGLLQGRGEILCPLDDSMYEHQKECTRIVPPCEIDVDVDTDIPKIINPKIQVL